MKPFLLYMRVCLLASCCCGYSSCRKSTPDSRPTVPFPSAAAAVVNTSDQFAFDLFHAVAAEDPSVANKMICPLSVYMALAMADNGAAGATADSIAVALRTGSLSLSDLNQTAKALLTDIPQADPLINLSIANSVWYKQSLSPVPLFLQTVQSNYQAQVQGMDFSSASTLSTINQWVASHTGQMIKEILTQIDSSNVMFLINAIYFKGSWTYSFDASATNNGPFTKADGTSENVPFMTMPKGQTFNICSNDTVTMVQIPYGNGDFSMYALLPGAGQNVHSLATLLNPGSFAQWQSGMVPRLLQVFLPKFEFSYATGNLAPELTDMGMGVAFTENADFSNMYSSPVSLSQVLHKTAIQVDESGTTAAGVTSVSVGASLATSNSPLIVYFNQPFLFVIREKTSGSLLFIGVLNDPLNAGS